MSQNKGRNMFVTGVIDVDLWNQAGWKGVLVASNRQTPPLLGLVFTNKQTAAEIFRRWRKSFGNTDVNEEIRIAIIEGDIPGRESGYSVHINTNVEGLLKRTMAQGLDISRDYITIVSRIHRMNPDPSSKNLDIFKEEYTKFREYHLVPAILLPGNKVELAPDLGITKREICFRKVEEITAQDMDYVVLQKAK